MLRNLAKSDLYLTYTHSGLCNKFKLFIFTKMNLHVYKFPLYCSDIYNHNHV